MYLRCWYNAVLCGGQNSRQRLAPRYNIYLHTQPAWKCCAVCTLIHSFARTARADSSSRRFANQKRMRERVFHLTHISRSPPAMLHIYPCGFICAPSQPGKLNSGLGILTMMNTTHPLRERRRPSSLCKNSKCCKCL
jgi:hypothetical protein